MGEHATKSELEVRNIMTEACLKHHVMPSEITLDLMCLAYTIGCEDTVNWARNQLAEIVEMAGRIQK